MTTIISIAQLFHYFNHFFISIEQFCDYFNGAALHILSSYHHGFSQEALHSRLTYLAQFSQFPCVRSLISPHIMLFTDELCFIFLLLLKAMIALCSPGHSCLVRYMLAFSIKLFSVIHAIIFTWQTGFFAYSQCPHYPSTAASHSLEPT